MKIQGFPLLNIKDMVKDLLALDMHLDYKKKDAIFARF